MLFKLCRTEKSLLQKVNLCSIKFISKNTGTPRFVIGGSVKSSIRQDSLLASDSVIQFIQALRCKKVKSSPPVTQPIS